MMKNIFKYLTLWILCLLLAPTWGAERTTYYHLDLLGSPTAATDSAGQVQWREEYKPYGGRVLNQAASKDNALWYTGKVHDQSMGLSYFGARWHNPELGRFTGIDPVGVSESNLHSFNRYAYANNNPYKFVDPDGNLPIVAVFFVATDFYSNYQSSGSIKEAAYATAIGAINPLKKLKTLVKLGDKATKKIPGPDGGFTADLTKSAAKSRSGHRNAGNKQLNDAMARDPQLRADIEKRFGRDAFDRTSTSGGGRRNPAGAEWDHSSSNPNQLDLRSKGNHRQKTSAEGQQGGGWKQFHSDNN